MSVTIITPYVYSASGFVINRRRVVQIDTGHHSENGFYPIKYLVEKEGLKIIDCLILTHPDQDHIKELPTLDELMQNEKIQVTTLLRNKTFPINQISEIILDESEAKKIYRKLHNNYNGTASLHHILTDANFGGVNFSTSFLDATVGRSSNDASVVVDVKFRNTQILIPGDLEESGAFEMITLGKMPLPQNNFYKILIAPHHGSETANPVELLKFYKPHLVLASVEEGHENTDATYSREEYVSGHFITMSNGVTEKCRFNGTKGETIHMTILPTYPLIERLPYEKIENPFAALFKTLFPNG